jgi:hypothetical protein
VFCIMFRSLFRLDNDAMAANCFGEEHYLKTLGRLLCMNIRLMIQSGGINGLFLSLFFQTLGKNCMYLKNKF